MEFLDLLLQVQVVIVVKQTSGKNLVRKKREWILPPKPLKENKDYTKELSIAKVSVSDQTDRTSVCGPGLRLLSLRTSPDDPLKK